MDVYALLRPLLFRLDPERAHDLTFMGLQAFGGRLMQTFGPTFSHKTEAQIQLSGLTFKNRIGLAAGLDKNALCLKAWAQMGFGHVEIGTVTPRPQAGNPSPRLFRLVDDKALINRMGFNNDGVDVVAKRLEGRPAKELLIVGGNIGKNKNTTEEDAYKDYVYCLKALQNQVDYITINISSPNTPGLRNLQNKEPLTKLLTEVQAANSGLKNPLPIFVKVAPDLAQQDLEALITTATECALAGLIATNTTISRAGLKTPAHAVEAMGAGGLSGQPLQAKALAFTTIIKKDLPAGMVLISSGGIMSAVDVKARIDAGADLVQIYTGLIYSGPGLVAQAIAAAQ